MRLPLFPAHSHHSSPSILQYSSLTLLPTTTTSSSATSGARRRLRWPRMDSSSSAYHRHRRKDKVVVIVGATGTGKSRLSVDIATRFPFSEIINSDKMQVYRGLDITTNKIPIHERLGVPHHLLGEVNPQNGEFTPSGFRSRGGSIVSDINSRRKLPLVVGGSNSFIHALLVDRFDPESDVFDGSSSTSISSEFRYNCCFLWVDVSLPVLSDYLSKRVDDMLDSGMLDELAEFYDPEAKDLEEDSAHRTGLRKAIGVPEFDRYFRKYPPPRGMVKVTDPKEEDAYEEAVTAIKDNTCQLVKRQIGKILNLKGAGWDLRRIDATEALRAAVTSENSGTNNKKWSEIWERQVVESSVKIVKRFLKE
ncbi:adenylate isopentenyltransferase [Quillaja saponaria]|uniref:adenylate dimethylallyltransferase (ADP/ATP-dependent) n=1 Tax=Quillaja saponaria TaxID=32244 RepID=A0AAD7KNK3_QUISA|nr:adenylate isopentenyltransferase [Quillaja saponaria]